MAYIKPPELSEEDLKEIHTEALARFNKADSSLSMITARWVRDMQFGTSIRGQWDDKDVQKRESAKKPVQTVALANKICDRVTADIISMNLEPKVTAGDDTEEARNLSTTISGILADISSSSKARQAVGTAIEGQVIGGFGYVLWSADYASLGSETINLTIDQVLHAESVLFDPAAESPNLEDAEWGMIVHYLDPKSHKSNYYSDAQGDKDWPEASNTINSNGWLETNGTGEDKDKNVRVCDYYLHYRVTGYLTPEGNVKSKDELVEAFDRPDAQDEIKAQIKKLMFKPAREFDFMLCCKMDGSKVLEHSWLLGAQRIPLVRFAGKLQYTPNQLDFVGLTPFLRPLQEGLNYQSSVMMQLIASTPVNQWISPKENKIHEKAYAQAPTGNQSVLYYETVDANNNQIPPPSRVTNSPQIDSALAVIGKLSDEMQQITGVYDLNDNSISRGQESSQTLLIRDQASQSIAVRFTFNDRIALQQVAQLAINTIPYYYFNETRDKVRIRNVQGHAKRMDITSLQTIDPDLVNELLLPSSGKGYDSHQAETANKTLQLLSLMAPEQRAAAMPGLVANLDMQNGEQLRLDLMKTLPPQFLQSGDEANQTDPAALKAIIAQGKAMNEQQAKKIEELEKTISTEVLSHKHETNIQLLKNKNALAIAQIKAESDVKKSQGEIQEEKIRHNIPGAAEEALNVSPTNTAQAVENANIAVESQAQGMEMPEELESEQESMQEPMQENQVLPENQMPEAGAQ